MSSQILAPRARLHNQSGKLVQCLTILTIKKKKKKVNLSCISTGGRCLLLCHQEEFGLVILTFFPPPVIYLDTHNTPSFCVSSCVWWSKHHICGLIGSIPVCPCLSYHRVQDWTQHSRCALSSTSREERSRPTTYWKCFSKYSFGCCWSLLLQRHIAVSLPIHWLPWPARPFLQNCFPGIWPVLVHEVSLPWYRISYLHWMNFMRFPFSHISSLLKSL